MTAMTMTMTMTMMTMKKMMAMMIKRKESAPVCVSASNNATGQWPLYAFLGDLYLMHRDEGLDHDDKGQHYNDGDTDLPVVEYFYFNLQTLVATDRVLKEVPVKN